MTERVVKWIRKLLIFVCIVIVIISWLLIRSVNSYYSPDILQSFHTNEDSFETLKEHLLKVGENEDIDVWYPIHVKDDHVSSRDDFLSIERLTRGKKVYSLSVGRGFFDKKMIVFRYVQKGDDGETPFLIIYAPNKNDISWYFNENSARELDRKFIEISDNWYYVSETFSSFWNTRLG